MPELPEVRAHAERLDDAFRGAELGGFRPITFTALKTAAPSPDDAVGRSLSGVGRRGKLLLLRFDDPAGGAPSPGDRTFVVHLMQGGRLKPDEKRSARPRGGVARWTFADGRALLLTEAGTERKAGVWVLAGDPEAAEPLAGLGPDADRVGRDELAVRLADAPMRVHGFLRDQRRIAGLGRRLANEVLHRARLSPFAKADTLDASQVDALHTAIAACLAEGLAAERARSDMSSSKERPAAVHHRKGEACPTCGDVVREVAYNRYTVSYCASCQTGGKVLADNTTSKFLK